MEELEEEDWDKIVEINLKGTFLVDQAVGIQMMKDGGGSIVNVASLSGVVANKGLLGHGAYCASKAAVIALTKVLATEWAQHNIRVNAVSPAYMDTGMLERTKSIPGLYDTQLDMTPMARYGRPEEFAATVLFLASDDSGYVTGHNLLMDGGYTAW
jgi:NAD(P)-dependent dehydrogenase (short-subunit alcohol dehydrogenase family)